MCIIPGPVAYHVFNVPDTMPDAYVPSSAVPQPHDPHEYVPAREDPVSPELRDQSERHETNAQKRARGILNLLAQSHVSEFIRSPHPC